MTVKWLTRLLFALVVLSGAALGQSFTNVTGQAKDAQGNLYVNCVYSIHFIGQSSQPGPYLLQGSVFQQTYAGVRCDGFGNFAIRLPSNQAIFPQPSGWEFNICDASGHFCNGTGTGIITIAGSSQDITAIMTPLLPILPPVTGEVRSIFGRTGQVVAVTGDYNVSQVTGAAPLTSPVFSGLVQVPTAPVGTFSPQAASTAFVMTAIGNAISGGGGGGGGGWNPPTAPGDTLFGNNSIASSTPSFFIPGGDISFSNGNFSVNQLHFGPNALALTNTGIATGNCLQVQGSNIVGGACGTGGGGAITSVFGRTGAIAAQTNDYSFPQISGTLSSSQLGSSLNLPGAPTAATAAPGTSTTQLATTAFVAAAVAAGGSGPGGGLSGSGTTNFISKFTAATVLGNSLLSDDGTTLTYTGSGGIVTPKFSITQGAFYLESVTGALPALPGANKNALVSGTDGWYVSNANGAYFKIEPPGSSTGGAVASVFTRTGAVTAAQGDYNITQITNGASTISPAFTGTPTAPTAAQTVSNTQLATTAFVHAAVAAGTPGTAGVLSFNTRQGAVVPLANDYNVNQITGAAATDSPTFTGVPLSVTPPVNDNSTKIATTEWIQQNYGPSSGGAGIAPIAPGSMQGCVSNDTATTNVLPNIPVNITAGETVLVNVATTNTTAGPVTTTVTDNASGGSNTYDVVATVNRGASPSTANLNLVGTAAGAAKAASQMTVTQTLAGGGAANSKFVVCIATFTGVHNVNVANKYTNSLANNNTPPITSSLTVEPSAYIYAASSYVALSAVSWTPVQNPQFSHSSTQPGSISSSICWNQNTQAAAAPVSCDATWALAGNYFNMIVAVELQPGVAAGPSFSGPKVVGFHRADINVTSAVTDTPFMLCPIVDCPAGSFYRIAWDFLGITGCTGGVFQVNVDYIDEASPTDVHHTGMMTSPGATITGANHVYGYRHMTVAAPLPMTGTPTWAANTGIWITTSVPTACSGAAGKVQMVVSIERLQ